MCYFRATMLTVVVVDLALVNAARNTDEKPQASKTQKQSKHPSYRAVQTNYSSHTDVLTLVALHVE